MIKNKQDARSRQIDSLPKDKYYLALRLVYLWNSYSSDFKRNNAVAFDKAMEILRGKDNG